MEKSPSLLDLAGAVADLTPIDWPALEAEALDPASRVGLARLRLLDRIVRACADIVPPGGSPDLDAPPATWGPLTIHERIGRGTFGDVYRAYDRRLDRIVALKLLKRRSDNDEAAGAEVIHEGQLLARVRHPNILTVYGAERIEGRVGVWMEFVDGRTLEEELCASGSLPAAAVTEIGLTLCSALEAVHDAGLLHRDLKAQNVMAAADGRLLLTDFGAGCARTEATADDAGAELAGTPLYLAPEVLNGASASVSSEVYSLGVLLYHLATGSFPVRGRTLRRLREAHAGGDRVGMRAYRDKLPRALISVIDRATHPDPAARFESVQTLKGALQGTRPRGRHRGTWGLVPPALALAIVAGLNAYWSMTPPVRIVEQKAVLERVVGVSPRFAKGDRIYVERADGFLLSMNPAQPANQVVESDHLSQYDLIDISPTRAEYLATKRAKPEDPPKLWAVGIATRQPRAIGNLRCDAASWGPDGRRIACVSGSELSVLNADGTGARRVAVLPPGDISQPRWSPRGDRIRLTVHTRDREHLVSRLWEVAVDSGGLRPLLAGWDTPPTERFGVWTSRGDYFVFSSERAGRRDLWAIREPRSILDWTRREPIQLTQGPIVFGYPLVVGGDGSIYTVGQVQKVGLVQLQRPSGRFVSTLSGIPAIWVTWSPDRKSITYVSFPEKKLWRADADGGHPRQLLNTSVEVDGSRWSPDGRWISFIGRLEGERSKIFLIAADGSSSPQSISPEDKDQGIPSWSPDSRKLCYGDVPKDFGIPDGGEVLHIFDMQTRQVSDVPGSDGLWSCRWSPDGKSLAAMTIETHMNDTGL